MSPQEPWQHLITVEQIVEMHSECIRKFGGDPNPIPSDGCVERSLGAAWSAELYRGDEEPVAKQGLCFAGCLLFYLIMNHCFTDGNKRIGWVACMDCLRMLGLTIAATDDEIEELCLRIVEKNIENAIQVVTWIAPRLEALSV